MESNKIPEGGEWLLSVAVDVVIFTLRNNDLQVYLVRRYEEGYESLWSLPGGIIRADEPLEDAAMRQLREQTTVEDIYLQQLYTFGAPDRDTRRRVISVAYFALVSPDQLARECQDDQNSNRAWFNAYNLPPLAFDHAEMLDVALTRLRYKIEYSAAAFELMPEEFTLRELQDAYMIILNDHTLDKANFRKKIREAKIVESVSRYKRTGGRPAKLYRFRKDAQLESKARRFFP
ncbi:MAG: NUDIX hydrolase [Anaerolineae bacterium]|nr:NUDIX hydrolase [Anaerolineae bacterium]